MPILVVFQNRQNSIRGSTIIINATIFDKISLKSKSIEELQSLICHILHYIMAISMSMINVSLANQHLYVFRWQQLLLFLQHTHFSTLSLLIILYRYYACNLDLTRRQASYMRQSEASTSVGLLAQKAYRSNRLTFILSVQSRSTDSMFVPIDFICIWILDLHIHTLGLWLWFYTHAHSFTNTQQYII